MQPLARTSSAGTSYTATQVAGFLTQAVASERYVFERLDFRGTFLSDLSPYVDLAQAPHLDHDTRRAVARTLRFRLRGDATINLSDLVRAKFRLLTPDGGYVEWVLGTFMLQPPEEEIRPATTWRYFTAADVTQFLSDASFTRTFSVPKGASYIEAIQQICNGYGGQTPIRTSILDPGKVLPASLVWTAGQSRLRAVNDLLAAINYDAAWGDENFSVRSEPIPDYSAVSPSYTFQSTAGGSILKVPGQRRSDPSLAYNFATVLVEDPRRTPFSQTYANQSPASEISIPNWGHPKGILIREPKLADASAAFAKARSEIQRYARIYAPLEMPTYCWPVSQHLDVYGLIYSTADEGAVHIKALETRWTMELRTGGSTVHQLEQIVSGV